MKKKFTFALSLVLCALLLLAPLTGASAGRYRSGAYYDIALTQAVYTDDLIPGGTNLYNTDSPLSSRVYIQYSDGTIVNMNATGETVDTGTYELMVYRGTVKGDSSTLWRCLLQDQGTEDSNIQLELVDLSARIYTKNQNNNTLCLHKGARSLIGEYSVLPVSGVESKFESYALPQGWKLGDIYDAELYTIDENTGIWTKATNAGSVDLALPYPDGASASTSKDAIKVLHMTDVIGNIEVLSPASMQADGVHVTVNSLSPFAVIYDPNNLTAVNPDNTGSADPGAAISQGSSVPTTGDASAPLLWMALMLCAMAAWMLTRRTLKAHK